jgi:hypothetical protein
VNLIHEKMMITLIEFDEITKQTTIENWFLTDDIMYVVRVNYVDHPNWSYIINVDHINIIINYYTVEYYYYNDTWHGGVGTWWWMTYHVR